METETVEASAEPMELRTSIRLTDPQDVKLVHDALQRRAFLTQHGMGTSKPGLVTKQWVQDLKVVAMSDEIPLSRAAFRKIMPDHVAEDRAQSAFRFLLVKTKEGSVLKDFLAKQDRDLLRKRLKEIED